MNSKTITFFLVLLMTTLSLANSSIFENPIFLDEEDKPNHVIVSLGEANISGFQEGSIYSNATISSGSGFTCAILDNGSVSCWGSNSYGQLGDGTTSDRNVPTPTSTLGEGRTATQISAGNNHVCAILNDGSVSCWGNNWYGQLGDGTGGNYSTDEFHRNKPTQTSSLGIDRSAIAISAGDGNTCVILDDGSVSCWGTNWAGQLGIGTTGNLFGFQPEHAFRNSPTPVSNATWNDRTAIGISVGSGFTCAILNDGSVSCWGLNEKGQLGDGSGENIYGQNISIPVSTTSFGVGKTAVAISSGFNTCVILNDGSVSCWGYNGNGRIGDGSPHPDVVFRNTPTPTSSLGEGRTAIGISVGSSGNCAILDDRTVSCWGRAAYIELHDGSTTEPTEPTQTTSFGIGRNVVGISVGSGLGCSLLDDGSSRCWGYNERGWIGDGTSHSSAFEQNTPTPIASLGENRTVAVSERDYDGDGVLNIFDVYPEDPSQSVDTNGDDDADGIENSGDLCPSTPGGESVNEQGCSNSEIDSDSDGVVDSIDNCPNTPFNTDVNQNGCSDSQNVDDSTIGGDTSNNNGASCQAIIDQNLAATRTCAIPQGDLDWDGLPDEPTNGFTTDEDRDGDGKLDSIELSDSAVGNDPDSIDYGIIMSPDLDFVHGLTATLNENEIELNVEYRMTISEMMFVLSLVAYSNEDGTPVDPQDYDLNLNSAKELNRLEQEMCKSPNTTVTDDELTIPRWLENFSIEGQNSPLSWECEWVERRSVNLMDFMMISDVSEIANWKDTVRYTLVLNDPTSDKTEVNVPLSNGTSGKVWELELKIPTGEQSMMYHPWAEIGSFIITNPLGDQNTQGDETQTTTPQITPTYTSAWSIIIDVKEGSVDCSGYSDTVNEATSWEDFENIYQQNDIDYSSLTGYHEYSNSDDNINLVCSGNVGFQEYSEENKKDDFCAYLFLYGDLKLSKCDSGYASMVSLMGEKTTFEEELDNLFNTDDVSDSSDFGSEMEEMLDSLLLGMAVIVLVLATIIAIAKQQQKLKEKRDSEKEMNEYESFTNQFHTNPKDIESASEENSGDNDESNDIEEPDQDPEHEDQAEKISELENHRSPSFNFQGEINDDGWEICEYPRSSGVWWWKDYESESWILWD